MKKVSFNIYKFSELSPESQERAIRDLCHINVAGNDWWDYLVEGVKEDLKCIGVFPKNVYFSLDREAYISFDGTLYASEIINENTIKELSGKNKKLEETIKDAAQEIRSNMHPLVISCIERGLLEGYTEIGHGRNDIKISSGHDVHGDFQYDISNIENEMEKLDDILEDLVGDIANFFLSCLEREYEYLCSEEAIIDTIEANEYEFYEDGSMF